MDILGTQPDSIVFRGMLRPTMKWGVPVPFLAVEMMVGMLAFAFAGNPLYLLLALPVHLFGWAVSLHDPHLFHTMLTVVAHASPTRNMRFWKRQSYAA